MQSVDDKQEYPEAGDSASILAWSNKWVEKGIDEGKLGETDEIRGKFRRNARISKRKNLVISGVE